MESTCSTGNICAWPCALIPWTSMWQSTFLIAQCAVAVDESLLYDLWKVKGSTKRKGVVWGQPDVVYLIVSYRCHVIMRLCGCRQMSVSRASPHPGIRLIAVVLPLSLKPYFVASLLTGAATRDTWMHIGSALHVVGTGFASDYRT